MASFNAENTPRLVPESNGGPTLAGPAGASDAMHLGKAVGTKLPKPRWTVAWVIPVISTKKTPFIDIYRMYNPTYNPTEIQL